ncbi:hypothetical protein GGR43_004332 [Sphingobium jiangsuense]|uniref:Uncharacterized protein n=1 Tax=Sphingobium jiangsuense TaxID=870476 RepID=A0A7W6FSC4_9SPHN|nr:hypothetical protein [Sphingobium jiangsuense]MBB3928587.1 hypothetical protein [Sphingobium jiangsuense]
MPKMSERERIADLLEKSRRIAGEIETAQKRLRDRYGAIVTALPVEMVAEKDFREALGLLLKLGGPAASVPPIRASAPVPRFSCERDPAAAPPGAAAAGTRKGRCGAKPHRPVSVEGSKGEAG